MTSGQRPYTLVLSRLGLALKAVRYSCVADRRVKLPLTTDHSIRLMVFRRLLVKLCLSLGYGP